jgi:hypothetical protein
MHGGRSHEDHGQQSQASLADPRACRAHYVADVGRPGTEPGPCEYPETMRTSSARVREGAVSSGSFGGP